MVEDATFIVIMDLDGAKSGGMPRAFYRALEKLQGATRIQKSVYLVTSVSAMKELVDLGRGCGFSVQAFEVVKDALTGEKKGKGEALGQLIVSYP